MPFGLVEVTPPTAEPITRAELKKHCEILSTDTAHDSYLDALIFAARQSVETYTGRQLVTATFDFFLDRLPVGVSPLHIPRPPLQSVSSVKYLDGDGVEQTWSSANYRVSTSHSPGRVTPEYGQVWPANRLVSDAVTVRFVAGYGTPADVPDGLKQALKLLAGHWFAHRESQIVGTSASAVGETSRHLMDQFRTGDEFLRYDVV